ncbi:alpha/beta hydrolase [Aquimarina sp. 2201CG5-10]|uniref:alpha/beta hydrolase n=1 Tax=Aquimarina callyspongiae TaxID=3098150 RepID=UPI002AB4D6A4|nr:alpha/beta hydrolase [Aquimarina sp. 2201CG5-10]MDY8137354.1 alpha/beta hydrolase [Aquimarina sp. 2201CG5-10]
MYKEFDWLQEGKKMYAQSWQSDNPIAVVCLVHGMGEHSSRYQHVADFLNNQDISLFTFDHIGHGKSEGKRGHTPNYDFLLDSVEKIVSIAYKEHQNIPLFVYGHSMGGNVVANYLLTRYPQVTGVILSAPWFTLPFEPPKFKVILAKLMNKIYPAFSDNTNLDVTAISRDKNVVEAYKNDTLVHGKITPSFFLSCFNAGKWAKDNGKKVSISTLVMHGTEDRLTSCKGSEEFASTNTLIEFKAYAGLYHELHNEPEQQMVLENVMSFIKSKL